CLGLSLRQRETYQKIVGGAFVFDRSNSAKLCLGFLNQTSGDQIVGQCKQVNGRFVATERKRSDFLKHMILDDATTKCMIELVMAPAIGGIHAQSNKRPTKKSHVSGIVSQH